MDAKGRAVCGRVPGVDGVAAGQGVGDGVEAAGAVLDGEVETEELVDPLMLRHGGEALVQQELQVVVVRAHTERPAPEVRPPVTHCLDKSDQLALISGELVVARGERATEEREGPLALVKNGTEPDAGGVAVHHEGLGEVWHL